MNESRSQQPVEPGPFSARLRDRVVIITGASSGLGESLARGLAAEGATLALAARREDRLQGLVEQLGAAEAHRCDIADEADRQRLVEATVERHGRIDGLLNNAGIGTAAPALRESTAEFEAQLAVNLTSAYALACLVAEKMKAGGGRAILNVASAMGLTSLPQVPEAGYVSSKAGLIGLTRELAVQWGRYGIRVNALAPGYFPSEMTEPLVGGEQGAPAWMLERTPLARIGAPSELRGPAAFLLSDESSFVTGHTLVVDGGLTLT